MLRPTVDFMFTTPDSHTSYLQEREYGKTGANEWEGHHEKGGEFTSGS
jgi:hypothetical protein